MAEAVGVTLDRKRLGGSAAGTEFERRTRDFLAATFPQLKHKSTAPTMWLFTNSRKSWAAGGWGDAEEMLAIMVNGKRLRDISDLPLDLTI